MTECLIERRGFTLVSVAGAVLLGVCTWALITAWGAIISGHPSYPVFYVAALGIGGTSIYRSVRRSSERRVVLSAVGSLGILVLAAASFWLRPFSAEASALEALENPGAYVVTTTSSAIMMEPLGDESRVGLVFQPGARIDARAYASMLAPIAAGGHPVVIVKQPLGIGFLALGSIPRIVEETPDIGWVAAGHSLGGVAASEATGEGLAGLLLWASYPADDISHLTELEVTSIYGTEDAITTVADITTTESRLPPQTVFVPIDGAIHSSFGDYGLQPGDGTATLDRATAREMIVAATLETLTRVQTEST
jgi:pimeloyl-ACP methyl ester carboxylesterase